MLNLDDMERIVQVEPEPEPQPPQQLPAAPVDFMVQDLVEPEPEPEPEPVPEADYIVYFIQTKCGLEFKPQWRHEGEAGTYDISGLEQLEILQHKLRFETSMLQGRLSPQSKIPVQKDVRAGAGIPENAESFCYVYPLPSLSNLLWPHAADELRSMRSKSAEDEGDAKWKWIDAILEGGFAYFDAKDELLWVSALSLTPNMTEQIFVGQPLDAQNVATEMDSRKRLSDPAETSLTTAGISKMGWISPGETFDGQLDAESVKDGAFLVLREPETWGESHVTWLYTMVDPTDEHYAEHKHKAQEHLGDDLAEHTLSGGMYGAYRREQEHQVNHADYEDRLAIRITRNVELKIEAKWEQDKDENKDAGTFSIVGPELQVKVLDKKLELTQDKLQGRVSPKHRVDMRLESRGAAGIPAKAATYCFLSPLTDRDALAKVRDPSKLQLARNPWAFALLAGGFAYFDDKDNLLAINAISFAPSPTGLVLIGREVQADFAVDIMDTHERLVDTVEPEQLGHLGWKQFGWVYPNETFSGKKLPKHKYEHGGFLYVHRHATYFYALTPHTSPGYSSELSKAQAQLQRADKLSHGYVKAINYAIAAETQMSEAKKLLDLSIHPNKLDKTYRLWNFSPEAREASRIKKNIHLMFFLCVFVGAGVMMFHLVGSKMDWDSGGEAWSMNEAVYFSVVVMSTVGYGDMGVIQELWPMLFTAVYILLGVYVVFSFAGTLYDEAFHPENGYCCTGCRRLRRFCSRERRRVRSDIEELFKELDNDKGGCLDKEELAFFVRKAQQHQAMKDVIAGHSRPFDLETDWNLMRKDAEEAKMELSAQNEAVQKAEAKLTHANQEGDTSKIKKAKKRLDEARIRLSNAKKRAQPFPNDRKRDAVNFRMFESWWNSRLEEQNQSPQADSIQAAIGAGKDAQQQNTLEFFSRRLLVPSFWGASFCIFISALVFKLIDMNVPDDVPDVSYSSYVWHCFITSTTVGFGDVLQGRSVSHTMLVWATIHILISTSWLASTVSQITDAQETRRHEKDKVKALNNKLNPSVIEDLGHFIENGQLNKWGFVLGKLIGQGAQLWGEELTIDNQIAQLETQFNRFDEYSSGFLTKDDLAHMLLQEQQEHILNKALEHVKKGEWDDLEELLFPTDEDSEVLPTKCALPDELINTVPTGKEYGLLHELIASASMDQNSEASCLSITLMDTRDRYESQAKATHDKLAFPGLCGLKRKAIVFDYHLKTSNGDTCLDVTQGNRHTPEPQIWRNDSFAEFLLEKCRSAKFKRHDKVYVYAQQQDWPKMKDEIFDRSTNEQLLPDTLINSLSWEVDRDEDGKLKLTRREFGLLHQLAKSDDGHKVHNDLVEKGVSFDYNLKTFVSQDTFGDTCDRVAEDHKNEEFLLMVRARRLEEVCKIASRMNNGQRLIDLIFDRFTGRQLLPDESINAVEPRKNVGLKEQLQGERWGLLHYLANWTHASRDGLVVSSAPYTKRACTGTAIHDILRDKGVKFDYGLKSELENRTLRVSPGAEEGRISVAGTRSATRTCVEVAEAAKNDEFTNMLLNRICDNAKHRQLNQLDDVLFDNDGEPAISVDLLNNLPKNRGGNSAPGLLHYLAAWTEQVKWEDPPRAGLEGDWDGVRWHDHLVNNKMKFNYSIKTPPVTEAAIEEMPDVLRDGHKTVGEIAKKAENHGFLAILLDLACECAKRAAEQSAERSAKLADELEELIFDTSGVCLIPNTMIDQLHKDRHDEECLALLHHLAAWTAQQDTTIDADGPETRDELRNGLTVLNRLIGRGVKFDYALKTSKGRTAVEIAKERSNDEFANMVQRLTSGEAVALATDMASDDIARQRDGARIQP